MKNTKFENLLTLITVAIGSTLCVWILMMLIAPELFRHVYIPLLLFFPVAICTNCVSWVVHKTLKYLKARQLEQERKMNEETNEVILKKEAQQTTDEFNERTQEEEELSEPEKIDNFNLGALLLPLLYSLSNRIYWSAIVLAVLYGLQIYNLTNGDSNATGYSIMILCMRIIIAISGPRMAWFNYQAKEGDDANPKTFKKEQRAWNIAGLVFCIIIVIAILFLYNR